MTSAACACRQVGDLQNMNTTDYAIAGISHTKVGRVGNTSTTLMDTSLSASVSSCVFRHERQSVSTNDTFIPPPTLATSMQTNMLTSTPDSTLDRKKRARMTNNSQDSGFLSLSNSSPDNTLPRRRKEVSRKNSHDLQKSNSSTSVESNTTLRPTHASLFSRKLSKLSTGLTKYKEAENHFPTFIGPLYSHVLQPKFPKPLYFEVPQCLPSPLSGRQWLFHEMREHLSSHLPTNRGIILAGGPGVGKTACILAMVEQSCFGNGKPSVHEGELKYRWNISTRFYSSIRSKNKSYLGQT